jgi:hypothetical protein
MASYHLGQSESFNALTQDVQFGTIATHVKMKAKESIGLQSLGDRDKIENAFIGLDSAGKKNLKGPSLIIPPTNLCKLRTLVERKKYSHLDRFLLKQYADLPLNIIRSADYGGHAMPKKNSIEFNKNAFVRFHLLYICEL